MLQIQWLRRWFRRNTRRIAEGDARVWKKRLSILYFLFAWNAFGVMMYQVFSGKQDWAKYHNLENSDIPMSPGRQWAANLGIPKANIIRISGGNISTIVYEDETQNEDSKEPVSSSD